MAYEVTYNKYPNGIEGERMESKTVTFDDCEKAIDYLHNRLHHIPSIKWAGGYITDDNGEWVYAINDCGEIEDTRPANERG